MKTCPHCGNAFEVDVRFCPHDGAALRVSAGQETLVGGVIAGRYEVVREVGRGGMGVVYLATHVQMERLCALKVLQSDSLVSPDAVSRFHREARNASRISHPNVVSVYDFGETEEGMTYLAMEYVEGRSLDLLLDEVGALSPRRTARIMWQIANGLNVAHDLKIVHRDLKPANIMLTRYRSWEDFVKVVDFGIAKAFGTTSTTSKVTTAGLVVGTPGYMSPEQWTGDEIDHRSDIYSLAMICVRMLAGAPPAARPSLPIAGKLLLDSIPTTVDWPEDLKAVLGRGLAPFPEERYDTVGQFATAFVTAITHWVPPTPGVREPWEERLTSLVTASEPPITEISAQVPSGFRRSRLLAGAGASLLLLGAVTWIVLALQSDPSSLAPSHPADSVRVANDTAGSPTLGPIAHQTPPKDSSRRREPARPVPAPAPPAAPGTLVSRPELADSIVALRAIFDLDRADPDSARTLVTRATGLLRQNLPDSARIEVAYLQAEAQLFLGAEAAACAALREVRTASETTGYFSRSIRLLLARHCK